MFKVQGDMKQLGINSGDSDAALQNYKQNHPL